MFVCFIVQPVFSECSKQTAKGACPFKMTCFLIQSDITMAEAQSKEAAADGTPPLQALIKEEIRKGRSAFVSSPCTRVLHI